MCHSCRMEDQTRRLVVIRHSKAEQLGRTDAERELAPRGRREAAAAGAWLAEQGLVPDHALVSASTRTRQTWQAMADAASWDLEPAFDQGLYAAGPEAALDLIRLVPAEARTVLVSTTVSGPTWTPPAPGWWPSTGGTRPGASA